jgi:hypothetical protein
MPVRVRLRAPRGRSVQAPFWSEMSKTQVVVRRSWRPALGFSECWVLEIARKAGHLPRVASIEFYPGSRAQSDSNDTCMGAFGKR